MVHRCPADDIRRRRRRIVGKAVAEALPGGVTAVGGLTMGADPIAIATAMEATPPLRAFSIRKEAEGPRHGRPAGRPDRSRRRRGSARGHDDDGRCDRRGRRRLAAESVTIACVIALVDRSGGGWRPTPRRRRYPLHSTGHAARPGGHMIHLSVYRSAAREALIVVAGVLLILVALDVVWVHGVEIGNCEPTGRPVSP